MNFDTFRKCINRSKLGSHLYLLPGQTVTSTKLDTDTYQRMRCMYVNRKQRFVEECTRAYSFEGARRYVSGYTPFTQQGVKRREREREPQCQRCTTKCTVRCQHASSSICSARSESACARATSNDRLCLRRMRQPSYTYTRIHTQYVYMCHTCMHIYTDAC